MSARSAAGWTLAIAIVLTACALLLRLHDITAQSLWWDEVTSWQQARLDLGPLIAATAADNYPPLYNLILHLSIVTLGDGEFALRLPSALLGALSVLALFWTGSRLVGRGGALAAAAMLYLSSFHLWYSQEARMYALLGLTSIVFAGAATRFVLTPTRLWAVLSAIAGALLLYSHPYGALEWASLVFAFALIRLRREGFRSAAKFAGIQCIALLLYAPWAAILLQRAQAIGSAGFWILPITPGRLLYDFELLLSGPVMLGAAAIAGIVAALPVAFRKTPRLFAAIDVTTDEILSRPAAILVLLCWGLLPAAAGVLASVLGHPLLIPRYLIGSLPALLLLAGLGLAQLPRDVLGLAGFLLLAIAAASGLLIFVPADRDDFRDAAAYLASNLKAGDCVVMSTESQIAMTYYRPQGFDCLDAHDPLEAQFGAMAPSRIFVLLTGADQATRPDITPMGDLVATNRFDDTVVLQLSPKPAAK